MKKLIAIMLALISIVGILGCLAGCGPKKPKVTSAADEIVIGIPQSYEIENFETNALTLWLEEQTGYKLTFQQYAASPSDYGTQLSVQILDPSVTLPHMLIHMDLGEAAWREYGDEGYFVDLTDLLMDKEGASKNFWDMANEYFDAAAIQNAIYKCSSGDRTKIYAIPSMEKSLVDPLPFIVNINKDWLEQVNMPAPTNTEELYQVLKVFKEQICVNESYYPMLCGHSSEIGGDGVWWLIAQFCDQYSYDNWFGVSADGKSLTTPFTTEGFREGVAFVRKLMAEGLLPAESLTMTNTDVQKITNNKAGSRVGVLVGHATPVFQDINNPNLNAYVPLDLYPSNQQAGYGSAKPGAFITEQAEAEGKVEACWKVLMELYTKEGSIRLRYGDEGENWDWVEEGSDMKSYLGLECWIQMYYDPFSQPNNEMWGTPTPTLNPQAENEHVYLGTTTQWQQDRAYLNGAGYTNFYKAQENNGYLLPEIVLTATEENVIKYIKENVKTTMNVWLADFCKDPTKDPNNSAVWNAYLKELNENGLEQLKNVYQNAYVTRYMETVIGSK